jgi:hypothetical protein
MNDVAQIETGAQQHDAGFQAQLAGVGYPQRFLLGKGGDGVGDQHADRDGEQRRPNQRGERAADHGQHRDPDTQCQTQTAAKPGSGREPRLQWQCQALDRHIFLLQHPGAILARQWMPVTNQADNKRVLRRRPRPRKLPPRSASTLLGRYGFVIFLFKEHCCNAPISIQVGMSRAPRL